MCRSGMLRLCPGQATVFAVGMVLIINGPSAAQAQTPSSTIRIDNAGLFLEGWHGEMEWSFHQKEDSSTPPDHSRAGTKFAGKATLRIYDNGRGGLLGVLEGRQNIDTQWWSYAPPGSKIFSQACQGSAPPTRVWARVEGSPPSGSNPLSLQLADVEAKITPTLSTGGSNAWCNATLFAQLTIDNGATISGLVRSLQPVGDGTYKAGFDQTGGLFEAHWSLILRPGYCGYGPDKGFVFYTGPGGPFGQGAARSEPSFESARIAQPAVGARYVYVATRMAGGARWFQLQLPGAGTGWLPARALSCVRPTAAPPAPPERGAGRNGAFDPAWQPWELEQGHRGIDLPDVRSVHAPAARG
jgi:hypothetical protein